MEFKKAIILVPGKKYIIYMTSCNWNARYSHTISHTLNGIHRFTNIDGDKTFDVTFYGDKIYEPISQKERIQSDMEQRALQLILKSIIGDESFSW